MVSLEPSVPFRPGAPATATLCHGPKPTRPAIGPAAHDSAQLAALGGYRRRQLPIPTGLVFYDQPATADGAIRHTAATPGGATATETLDITLNGLQHDVHRVVAAVSVDGGRFADVYELRVIATTTSPATE